jgi:hypothetical protein
MGNEEVAAMDLCLIIQIHDVLCSFPDLVCIEDIVILLTKILGMV